MKKTLDTNLLLFALPTTVGVGYTPVRAHRQVPAIYLVVLFQEIINLSPSSVTSKQFIDSDRKSKNVLSVCDLFWQRGEVERSVARTNRTPWTSPNQRAISGCSLVRVF